MVYAYTDGLIPFTRWVTPTNVPKRFTTQMYIYMLPLSRASPTGTSRSVSPNPGSLDNDDGPETVIPPPTHDGGKEHTAARFLPAATWLRLATSGRIILFPPQFFLLHLLSRFLTPQHASSASTAATATATATTTTTPVLSNEILEKQRKEMLEFVKGGDPTWGTKCISPTVLALPAGGRRADGRVVLGLDRPGPEVQGQGRAGEKEHVVLVEFKKEGPRRVEVGLKKDVLAQGRESKM